MSNQVTEAGVSEMSNLSLEVETEKNQMPIAGPSNEQPSPKIFKLDIDCMDEIFEYLSLKDLDAFAQTCKAMHKVAGEYFKRNYSDAQIHIAVGDEPKLVGIDRYHSYSSSTFNQFVDTIKFQGSIREKHLLCFASHPNEFEAVTRLILDWSKLDEKVIDTLNGILSNLEILAFRYVFFNANSYDMLKKCTNLKMLHFFGKVPEADTWMHQKYPKLETIGLTSIPSIDDLKTFFQNNPNVRSFCTDPGEILEHGNEIMNSNLQLDLLKILIEDSVEADFSVLLNQLYERKFYKRLHVFMNDDVFFDGLDSLRGLELLHIGDRHILYNWPYMPDLPDLPDLKELRVTSGIKSSQQNLNPKKFSNLQKLWITNANDETIMSIIRGLPKLKTLTFLYDEDAEKNSLKLRTLNTERGKVVEAQKVTIEVPDEVFLKTKWSCGNGDTNLQMVEMKRIA